MNRERDAKGRFLPTHRMTGTPTYRAWSHLIERCENPKTWNYSRYGGRGISVCPEWHDFKSFLMEMGEKPIGLEIDRIDNNQGYTPENTRWVSRKQNCRNRRNNRVLTFKGETYCLAAWAERTGIAAFTLSARLNKLKWSVERALTEPVQVYNRMLKLAA